MWAGVAAAAAAGVFGGSVFAGGGSAPVVAGIVEGSFKQQGVESVTHLALIIYGSKLNKVRRVSLAAPGLSAPFTEAEFTSSNAIGSHSPTTLVADFLTAVAPGAYDVYFDVPTAIAATDTFTPAGKVVITNAATSGAPGSLGQQGTINAASNPVDWTQLKNVPAGFADGVDATVALAGNGTATTASHSDHNHDATYVLKAGDTMTGSLTVSSGVIAASSTAGTNALVARYSGGGTASTSANNCALFQTAAGSNVARIDNTGKGYFNGGTAVTGADFAESVAVKGPVREFEPGDVIVIDTTSTRRFAISTTADSPLVAGVYATKPGVVARPFDVAGDLSWKDREIPLAMVGIVPTKACDEGGAIRVGDLLVTSSIRGRAKRAPANPAPGTIIGKALGAMDGSTGSVEVLLLAR
jgi:hypothetical protein